MHAALVQEQQMIGSMLAQAAPVSPGTAQPGTLVRLAGVARPGAGGVLRSPEAGVPCVWFRTVVIPMRRSYAATSPAVAPGLPAQGISSATDVGVWAMPGIDGDQPATDHRSDAPFAIEGPDGTLEILPAGGHIDSLIQSINHDQVQRTITHRDDRLAVEWIIPPGVPIYAIGMAVQAPDGHRALVSPQGGKIVVSTRDEQALQGMAAYFANQSAAGPGRLPIGPGGRTMNPVVLAVTVGVLVVVVLVVVAVLAG
jgi:hypothetical protein